MIPLWIGFALVAAGLIRWLSDAAADGLTDATPTGDDPCDDWWHEIA